MTPLANILHRDTLEALVGTRMVERAETYFRQGRVTRVVRRGTSIHSHVRGNAEYAVKIWVSLEGLAYACTCPFGGDGRLCKHAVATAIAWMEREASHERAADVRARFAALDPDDLVEILARVASDPNGAKILTHVLDSWSRD